jgi:hypothetical protein
VPLEMFVVAITMLVVIVMVIVMLVVAVRLVTNVIVIVVVVGSTLVTEEKVKFVVLAELVTALIKFVTVMLVMVMVPDPVRAGVTVVLVDTVTELVVNPEVFVKETVVFVAAVELVRVLEVKINDPYEAPPFVPTRGTSMFSDSAGLKPNTIGEYVPPPYAIAPYKLPLAETNPVEGKAPPGSKEMR